MSEMLSQDEIDALLKGSSAVNKQIEDSTDEEMDVVSEISNASMSVVSNYLLSKLKKKTSIKVKKVGFASPENYTELFSESLFAIEVEMTEGIFGKKLFLFKMDDVAVINDLSIGGDGINIKPEDVLNIQTEILLELIIEVMPDAVSAISNLVKENISISNPQEFHLGENNEELKAFMTDNKMISVIYDLEVGNIINSRIIELLPVSMAKKLTSLLLASVMPEAEQITTVESNLVMGASADKEENLKNKHKKKQPITIQPVKFPSFDASDDSQPPEENIDFILDVPLQISVELGRCKKTIKEILDLNIGSIVELNNMAEDYVDVLVNGKLIARGEVIVVDENFGIRIMELYTNNQKTITEKE